MSIPTSIDSCIRPSAKDVRQFTKSIESLAGLSLSQHTTLLQWSMAQINHMIKEEPRVGPFLKTLSSQLKLSPAHISSIRRVFSLLHINDPNGIILDTVRPRASTRSLKKGGRKKGGSQKECHVPCTDDDDCMDKTCNACVDGECMPLAGTSALTRRHESIGAAAKHEGHLISQESRLLSQLRNCSSPDVEMHLISTIGAVMQKKLTDEHTMKMSRLHHKSVKEYGLYVGVPGLGSLAFYSGIRSAGDAIVKPLAQLMGGMVQAPFAAVGGGISVVTNVLNTMFSLVGASSTSLPDIGDIIQDKGQVVTYYTTVALGDASQGVYQLATLGFALILFFMVCILGHLSNRDIDATPMSVSVKNKKTTGGRSHGLMKRYHTRRRKSRISRRSKSRSLRNKQRTQRRRK